MCLSCPLHIRKYSLLLFFQYSDTWQLSKPPSPPHCIFNACHHLTLHSLQNKWSTKWSSGAAALVAGGGSWCCADFQDGILDDCCFPVNANFQPSGEVFDFFLTLKLDDVSAETPQHPRGLRRAGQRQRWAQSRATEGHLLLLALAFGATPPWQN